MKSRTATRRQGAGAGPWRLVASWVLGRRLVGGCAQPPDGPPLQPPRCAADAGVQPLVCHQPVWAQRFRVGGGRRRRRRLPRPHLQLLLVPSPIRGLRHALRVPGAPPAAGAGGPGRSGPQQGGSCRRRVCRRRRCSFRLGAARCWPRHPPQASSMDFLARCGFDFNKVQGPAGPWGAEAGHRAAAGLQRAAATCLPLAHLIPCFPGPTTQAIYDGVSYLTVEQRDRRLAALERPPRERNGVLVSKPEDVAFVGALVAQVSAWLQARQGGRAARCRRWVCAGFAWCWARAVARRPRAAHASPLPPQRVGASAGRRGQAAAGCGFVPVCRQPCPPSLHLNPTVACRATHPSCSWMP